MTDNDIIKALEKMTYGGHSCMHCQYGAYKGDDRCGLRGCKIGRDALDLINRQQEEIERLRLAVMQARSRPMHRVYNADFVKYKALLFKWERENAIKEFAERLSDRICDAIEESSNNPNGEHYYITDVYETIENLVAEMTEGVVK